MVFYFSGTGNSRFAAQIIAKEADDELVSMNELIRGQLDGVEAEKPGFSSEKPYVFVCPTYCYRIPHVVESFIRGSVFAGCRQMYFYLTCGDSSGAAAKHAEGLCRQLGFEFMGLDSVLMPENYITMFAAPSYDDAQGIIRAAVSCIESAGRLIAAGRPISNSHSGSPLATAVNPAFYKLFVNDKLFYSTDACVSCGLCAEVCPLKNISLKSGRPVWGGNCTQCMACIGRCPQNAIEFGRRSLGKRRYYLRPDGTQRS